MDEKLTFPMTTSSTVNTGNPLQHENKRLLFVVNVDWFFLSHRLAIALAAQHAGFEVYVAAADTGAGVKIKELGLNFIPLPFSRKGTHLFSEALTILKLYKLYKKLDPDIVHHVTIKPVLFGSFVAYFRKRVSVVNAITGLGFTFSRDKRSSLLGYFVRTAYRIALKNPRQRTIFQNPDDRDYFVKHAYVRDHQTAVIRGSGVDCDHFVPSGEGGREQIVLLASRMIRDKGIFDFYEAAKHIKKSNPEIRFVLAGMCDQGNPNAVSVEQLKNWNREGIVEWWGHCTNMAEVLQKVMMVVLPTVYPEGTPKILIEAAACGKPIVTTDRPGCREIVQDGVNGKLIEPKNIEALTEAIRELIKNPEMAKRYGAAGRKIAVQEFSDKIVVSKTLELYSEILDQNSAAPGNGS